MLKQNIFIKELKPKASLMIENDILTL